MDQLLQHIANAVMLGSIYPLGIGLTMIFGIMGVVNFAHGELYTFGAYMMFLFVMVLKVDFFISIFLAIALGIGLGAFIKFMLLRRLLGSSIDTTMIVMIGAS